MDRIGIEQENYLGEYCGYTMILQGVKGKAIKDSNTLTFTVRGFTKKKRLRYLPENSVTILCFHCLKAE